MGAVAPMTASNRPSTCRESEKSYPKQGVVSGPAGRLLRCAQDPGADQGEKDKPLVVRFTYIQKETVSNAPIVDRQDATGSLGARGFVQGRSIASTR